MSYQQDIHGLDCRRLYKGNLSAIPDDRVLRGTWSTSGREGSYLRGFASRKPRVSRRGQTEACLRAYKARKEAIHLRQAVLNARRVLENVDGDKQEGREVTQEAKK